VDQEPPYKETQQEILEHAGVVAVLVAIDGSRAFGPHLCLERRGL
jgi:hypothetical protein